MISKIEKARRYAEEPERIQINQLKATFRGSNGTHLVTLQNGQWYCDSPTFDSWGTTAHIMAVQKLLEPMLAPEARELAAPTGVHMHSDMARKIEKARRYAEEPERVQISELKASFQGTNDQHIVTLEDGKWYCDSSFFRNWGTTAHIMAMQKLLEPMLSPEARQPASAELADLQSETASL
jgi:hypothetical protein